MLPVGGAKPKLARRAAAIFEEEKLNALQLLLDDPSLGPNLQRKNAYLPADFGESSSSHYESESSDDLSMSSSPISKDGEVLEDTNGTVEREEEDGDVFRITLTKTPEQTDGTFYKPPPDVLDKVLPTIKEDSESKNTTLSSMGNAKIKKGRLLGGPVQK